MKRSKKLEVSEYNLLFIRNDYNINPGFRK